MFNKCQNWFNTRKNKLKNKSNVWQQQQKEW